MLKSTCSALRKGKVLYSTIAKPGMFGLVTAQKEHFLAYSIQFFFSIIRLVPRNVVAIDMCGKNRITEEWIYGIKRKHVLPVIFFVYLFICSSV